MAQLDENKLHQFVGKMLGDLGGAFSVPTVRIGLRLGLFNALHEGGSPLFDLPSAYQIRLHVRRQTSPVPLPSPRYQDD